MKKISILAIFLSIFLYGQSQTVMTQRIEKKRGAIVEMETNYGKVRFLLYEETPMHKENFIKLVESEFYNGLLFHRVIKKFMIQGGDPKSREAKPGQILGEGSLDYTIPPEFNPELFHKRGALCAARWGDDVNPKKESSSCQFYIVQGRVFSNEELDRMEANGVGKFSPEQRKVYTTIGGAPHLDGNYTVFGEVIEGMDVVDKICMARCDKHDRPERDVVIIKMKLIE
ncbi:MAG: peptidylprolyl isomerase [Bacteroidales bacterium]|jgi:peptidyl-prolyl cis-trans isomerase B (cyclophilin B)|nr:peptidylprolyl isomerase [Bacteroidales bacterium]